MLSDIFWYYDHFWCILIWRMQHITYIYTYHVNILYNLKFKITKIYNYQCLEKDFHVCLTYSAFSLKSPFTVFNHVYRRSLARSVMGKNNGWAIQSLLLFLLKRNGKRFPSVWLSYNCESNFGMNPFTSGTFNKFLGQPCGIHWFPQTVYSLII